MPRISVDQLRGGIPQGPGAPELVDYFGNAERSAGFSSSFETLVSIAFGGGSARDPDRRMVQQVDRRRGNRHALVRRALLAIAPSSVIALSVAFGPEDWRAIADQAFGRGAGQKLVRGLGSNAMVGIALLTRTVRDGHAEELRRHQETEDASSETVVSWRIDKLGNASAQAFVRRPKEAAATRYRRALATPGGWLLRAVEQNESAAVAREAQLLVDRSFAAWTVSWNARLTESKELETAASSRRSAERSRRQLDASPFGQAADDRADLVGRALAGYSLGIADSF